MNIDDSQSREVKAGDRIFLHGLPGNGFINFGKIFNGHQAFFTEDGCMWIPKHLADEPFDEIIESCGFRMKDRHPSTYELLDYE